MPLMPVIDREKCQGCGLCVSVCACGALVLIDGKATVVGIKGCDFCTRWCALCEAVCPNEAISCPFEIVIEES